MTDVLPEGFCTVELWTQMFAQILSMGIGFGMVGGFVIGLALYRFATALLWAFLDAINAWLEENKKNNQHE